MPRLPRPILTSLLIFGAFAQGLSQDSTVTARTSIGIGTAFAYSAIKSEKFSPLTQTGSGLPFQVYYRRVTPTRQLHVQYLYTSFSLSSDFGALVTSEQNHNLQAAAHYRVGRSEKRIATWLGAVVDGQGVQRSYSSPLNGSAVNNTSGEAFVSLNPSVLFETPTGKNKISLQVWAALLACIFRPDNAGGVQTNFVSLGSFSKTEARLSYSIYLSRHWDVRVDGQFQYYAMSVAEPLYKLNSQAIASIVFKL